MDPIEQPHPETRIENPYWCFISYRHADNKDEGRQWATWLHQSIEMYQVPEELVGTKNWRGDIIPERIFPVFRDEDELPADADLASPIYRALDRSLFLVVLCSPRAVASAYVDSEIHYFKKIGRADRVLAAIIDGEPNASWDEAKHAAGILPDVECFPKSLRHPVEASGRLIETERAEPVAADFRPDSGMTQGWTTPEAYRRSLIRSGAPAVDQRVARYRKQCELAKLKIIAGIIGVPLGELTKRDQAYRLEIQRRRARTLRRWLYALSLLLVFSLIGAGVAYWQWNRAEAQATRAEGQADRADEQANLAKEQADIAEKQATRADEQAKRAEEEAKRAEEQAGVALKRAYVSELRIALDLIGKRELSSAREMLLEIPAPQRQWEWAYLMSRCGASPRAIGELLPDNQWMTTTVLDGLKAGLDKSTVSDAAFEIAGDAFPGSSYYQNADRRLQAGERVILTTPYGGGDMGGYGAVYQGSPPAHLFSYWAGTYASGGRAALSDDGSLIAWECEHGEMDWKNANVSTGDWVKTNRSIATVPDRIRFPSTKPAATPSADGQNGTGGVAEVFDNFGIYPSWPSSRSGDDFRPAAEVSFAFDGEVRFVQNYITGRYSDAVSHWSLLVRKLDGPAKHHKDARHRNVIESDIGFPGIREPFLLDDVALKDFFIRLRGDDTGIASPMRAFSGFVNRDGKRLVLTEGNGIELWDPETARRVEHYVQPDTTVEDVGFPPIDKARIVGDRIVGCLWDKQNPSLGRFYAVGRLPGADVITFLKSENGERVPAYNGGVGNEWTQLTVSPRLSTIIRECRSRNQATFEVWNGTTGELLKSTDGELPGGYGWSADEEIFAFVDESGILSLSDKYGGKEMRAYPGIKIEGGIDFPVVFSPDRKRILVSNLIVDAETLDAVLLLRPGTRISADWKTVVSWVDETTAEINDLTYWRVLNVREEGSRLHGRDRMLVREIIDRGGK